jgi:hypothetical protein
MSPHLAPDLRGHYPKEPHYQYTRAMLTNNTTFHGDLGTCEGGNEQGCSYVETCSDCDRKYYRVFRLNCMVDGAHARSERGIVTHCERNVGCGQQRKRCSNADVLEAIGAEQSGLSVHERTAPVNVTCVNLWDRGLFMFWALIWVAIWVVHGSML